MGTIRCSSNTLLIPRLHVESLAYFDTVVVLVLGELDATDKNFLSDHCGSPVHPRSSKRPGWTRIQLQQPNQVALQRLADIWETFDPRPCLSRIDVALDLTTATTEQAIQLTRWIEARLFKRHHGRQTVKRFLNSRYTASRAARTLNIATYGDKASKVTGEPCAHLEFRMQRARVCRNQGLHSAKHLIDLNFRDFLVRNFALREIDYLQMARQAKGRGRAKQVTQRDRQIAGLLIRWFRLQTQEEAPSAQQVHSICRTWPWFRANTAFRDVPIDDFLPSSPM